MNIIYKPDPVCAGTDKDKIKDGFQSLVKSTWYMIEGEEL